MGKIQITLNKEQQKMLGKFKPILGNSDAEVLRNIFLVWLTEKGYIKEVVFKK